MDIDEQILQGFKKMAGEVGPLNTILVQVVSVNEGEQTCVVIDDDIEYYDVRLRPVINGNTCFTIFPKVDTWVLIIRIEDDNAWQVISVDEADKVKVITDTTTFEINEGVLIERGSDTLKEALTLIIEAVQQTMVIYGNNPDFVKLAQAQTKIDNILK